MIFPFVAQSLHYHSVQDPSVTEENSNSKRKKMIVTNHPRFNPSPRKFHVLWAWPKKTPKIKINIVMRAGTIKQKSKKLALKLKINSEVE